MLANDSHDTREFTVQQPNSAQMRYEIFCLLVFALRSEMRSSLSSFLPNVLTVSHSVYSASFLRR